MKLHWEEIVAKYLMGRVICARANFISKDTKNFHSLVQKSAGIWIRAAKHFQTWLSVKLDVFNRRFTADVPVQQTGRKQEEGTRPYFQGRFLFVMCIIPKLVMCNK